MDSGATILVVDADPNARALLGLVLPGRLGSVHMVEAADALSFAAALADIPWSAAVVDPELPWADGLALVEQLLSRHPERPVWVYTAMARPDDAIRVIGAGALDYVAKDAAGAVRLAEGLARELGSTIASPAGAAQGAAPVSAAAPRHTVTAALLPDYHDRWRTLASQARERGYDEFEVRALENAVELQPEDDDVVERLIALHARGERWRRVAELLAMRAETTVDSGALRRLYKRLISVQTERMGDAEAGIATYLTWRSRDPHNDELRRVLLDLLQRLERWPILASVQRALADEAGSEADKARWLHALAHTLAAHLGRSEEAEVVRAQALALAPAPTPAPPPAAPEQTGPTSAPQADRRAAERPTRPFRVASGDLGAVLELVASGGASLSAAMAQAECEDGEPPPVPTEAMVPAAGRDALHALAHDLQEPIRSVANYLSVLESRHGADLAGEGRALVDKARAAARRMQERVHALVRPPAVASNRPSVISKVDTAALVRGVVADLGAAIEASGGSVEVGELPCVDGDEQSLARLFQNLISNGLKFRAEAPPLVRVEAAREEGRWRFAVRDNGIGIDAADRERVFGMFSRGRHEGAFPGSGIGLAVCKRAVEAHGGRIWIESEPWQGTTVLFTVPVPADDVGEVAKVGSGTET